jgi:hypothetical protein
MTKCSDCAFRIEVKSVHQSFIGGKSEIIKKTSYQCDHPFARGDKQLMIKYFSGTGQPRCCPLLHADGKNTNIIIMDEFYRGTE